MTYARRTGNWRRTNGSPPGVVRSNEMRGMAKNCGASSPMGTVSTCSTRKKSPAAGGSESKMSLVPFTRPSEASMLRVRMRRQPFFSRSVADGTPR